MANLAQQPILFLADYLLCTDVSEGATVPVYNLGDYGGSAVLACPQWPGFYHDESDCHYSLEASDPANQIQIEVTFWDVRTIFNLWAYFS